MKAPLLLVSYSSVDEYLNALDPEIRKIYGQEIESLVSKNLPPVVSTRCLATLFGYSERFVNVMCSENVKYYRTFNIKQGRKFRKIHAPKVSLKVIQKWLGYHLSNALEFDDFVFGFISGRSAIDAANVHTNAKWVYSVDIKDFFQISKTFFLQLQAH